MPTDNDSRICPCCGPRLEAKLERLEHKVDEVLKWVRHQPESMTPQDVQTVVDRLTAHDAALQGILAVPPQ